MCIVIDTCALAYVFDPNNKKHHEFVHVENWISKGHGFLVFGGTRYKNELYEARRYLRLIIELKKAGKAVAIQDEIVDKEEERVRKLTDGTDCDDQHIIGLLSASRCPIVCSDDKRAFKYFKNKNLYPDGMKEAKIYSESRSKNVLKRPIPRSLLKNQA